MRAKRVPPLNWPSRLFRDIGAAALMMEDEEGLFAEEADIAAQIEILIPAGVNTAIVRYSYPEQAGGPHA
jgi:hypothetical protein